MIDFALILLMRDVTFPGVLVCLFFCSKFGLHASLFVAPYIYNFHPRIEVMTRQFDDNAIDGA